MTWKVLAMIFCSDFARPTFYKNGCRNIKLRTFIQLLTLLLTLPFCGSDKKRIWHDTIFSKFFNFHFLVWFLRCLTESVVVPIPPQANHSQELFQRILQRWIPHIHTQTQIYIYIYILHVYHIYIKITICWKIRIQLKLKNKRT